MFSVGGKEAPHIPTICEDVSASVKENSNYVQVVDWRGIYQE
jgi:hypothetical protein